jgi:hypothetical protein
VPEPIFRVAGDIAVLAFEGVIYGIRRHVIPGVGTTAYTVREESERAPGDAAMLRRWLQEVAA